MAPSAQLPNGELNALEACALVAIAQVVSAEVQGMRTLISAAGRASATCVHCHRTPKASLLYDIRERAPEATARHSVAIARGPWRRRRRRPRGGGGVAPSGMGL